MSIDYGTNEVGFADCYEYFREKWKGTRSSPATHSLFYIKSLWVEWSSIGQELKTHCSQFQILPSDACWVRQRSNCRWHFTQKQRKASSAHFSYIPFQQKNKINKWIRICIVIVKCFPQRHLKWCVMVFC